MRRCPTSVRVAGIISAVPQTPLSHVNLRAGSGRHSQRLRLRTLWTTTNIKGLLGSYVHYSVTAGRMDTVRGRHARRKSRRTTSLPGRPTAQTPQRDLSITSRSLPSATSDLRTGTPSGSRRPTWPNCGTLGSPRGDHPRRLRGPVLFLRRVHESTTGSYDDVAEMLADAEFPD